MAGKRWPLLMPFCLKLSSNAQYECLLRSQSISISIILGVSLTPRGGGTDLERGYGDVRPWRPPFHTSPAARKGPISSKRVSSQDPLLRKFGNFSLNSLNFHPNFSSQAPKFGNFQLTSLEIWKFSAHKPPNLDIFRSQAPLFRGKCPFASPTLWKSGPHTPTWKKVECPPRPYTRIHLILECPPGVFDRETGFFDLLDIKPAIHVIL